jgi:hypothetical protein
MSMEDDLGWEYFGPDPEASPRMMEHMDWHNDPANQNKQGNYGERFLLFHKQFVDKFDVFRQTKGLIPVSAWDPTTPIPASLSHDHVLMMARDTDNPYAVNPHCKTPTWATSAGGADHDPIHGYTKLAQFQSLDELGRSIDSGWHGTVHNTIGGDMSMFHSPIDPIFWRWHKWIDNIRASWVAINAVSNFNHFNAAASVVQILFGVTNDAPGVVIGPDGVPHHVPGGPGDPVWKQLSSASRDVLIGLAVGELGSMVSHAETRVGIQKMSTHLLNMNGGNVFSRNLDAEGRLR